MNDEPIRLKVKDSPSPDPQVVAIELSALLRALADDALHLRDLVVGWDANPVAVQRRAATRAVEIAEQAALALDAGETLMQAYRYSGLFSASYEGVAERR